MMSKTVLIGSGYVLLLSVCFYYSDIIYKYTSMYDLMIFFGLNIVLGYLYKLLSGPKYIPMLSIGSQSTMLLKLVSFLLTQRSPEKAILIRPDILKIPFEWKGRTNYIYVPVNTKPVRSKTERIFLIFRDGTELNITSIPEIVYPLSPSHFGAERIEIRDLTGNVKQIFSGNEIMT